MHLVRGAHQQGNTWMVTYSSSHGVSWVSARFQTQLCARHKLELRARSSQRSLQPDDLVASGLTPAWRQLEINSHNSRQLGCTSATAHRAACSRLRLLLAFPNASPFRWSPPPLGGLP